MNKERESFGSRASVIMAMAGSAIGLGNIWRFPYMVGQYGGAAFVIVYMLASFLLCLPILLSETIIGRRSRSNTFGAMDSLAPGTKWKWLGLLTVISPIILLSYYSVVGGWSVEYLFKSCLFSFNDPSAVSGMFGRFISSIWAPIICHTVFLLLTAGVIVMGVKSGIEKFTKITIPLLFVLIVLIMIYSLSLPGAKAGVDYMVKPDFSKIDASSCAAAMGQAFFSLSLGVGTMLTYASYVRKDENLFSSGILTAVSDLLFAVLAGFAIMPAVFAVGIQPNAGPGLVFETLPFIFSKMGMTLHWVSGVTAILFFITILVAALTSSISMMEVGVAYLVEEKHFTRFKATALIFLCTWLTGILCSLSFGPLSDVHILGNSIFDCLDKLCSDYLLPFGGLLFSLFVGWKMPKPEVRDEFTNGESLRGNRRWFPLMYFLIKYAAPIGVVTVFATNLLTK